MQTGEREKLVRGAAELGIDLSDDQVLRFERYAALLEEWNQRMNLTRIPADQVVPMHFLDSLTVSRAVELEATRSAVDVGSGAGFPGLPLKIAFPHLKVVLLDSTRKRLGFLEAVIGELGLDGVRTLHARAEDAGRKPAIREAFDLATARAVADMSQLAEWLLPFVKVGGAAVALKSGTAHPEIAAAEQIISRMGGSLEPAMRIRLPGTDIERELAVVRKVRATALQYPRSPAARKRA